MKLLQTAVLLAATITTGLMAGLFAAFAYAVMPGLHRSGDRAFVEVMRNINKAILNGWFMLIFLGSLVFIVAATVLSWRGFGRAALPWLIAALVLYLAMFVITSGVNVPLNNGLEKAGDPAHIADLAGVRHRFEASWITWNIIRAFATIAAFGCLAWALVLFGADREQAHVTGRSPAPATHRPVPLNDAGHAGFASATPELSGSAGSSASGAVTGAGHRSAVEARCPLPVAGWNVSR